MQPITCDLSNKLGEIRFKNKFIYSLHFSDKSRFGKTETKVIKEFLDAFISSNACYRAILASPIKWSSLNEWDSKARLAGVLFSHPWMPAEGKLFNTLSRARIIFDRNSMNPSQIANFHRNLNRTLRRQNKVDEKMPKQLKDSAIVFADRHIFDELQLVDIINGIIRLSYLINQGIKISESKKDIHDYFLSHFPQLKSFSSANRLKCQQKINVWEFAPK